MAQTDPNAIGDDWLKVTEARYDSMKHLLQSVKQDIDALTHRIDSTQKSPTLEQTVSPRLNNSSGLDSPGSTTHAPGDHFASAFVKSSKTPQATRSSKPENKIISDDKSCDPGSEKPDILANVHTVTESRSEEELHDLVEVDEYMDIRIREDRNPFSFQQNLIDCTIGSVHSDLPGSDSGADGVHKTWRSPSDFSLRDPFEEDQLNQEFERQIISNCQLKPHAHAHMKETDLDDLEPHRYEKDDESGDSLSPAVSPTFELFAAETVQLKNMLFSNEETEAMGLKPGNTKEKLNDEEEYQVYDNGYSLTTIDEASEEVEDELSSSDLDSSLNSNDGGKEHAPTGMSTACSKRAQANVPSAKSIDDNLKSAVPHSEQTHDDQLKDMADDYQARSDTLKRSIDKEQRFVLEVNTSHATDPSPKPTECVILRSKRVNPDLPAQNQPQQRPISVGSFRGSLKRTEKSPTGSLHSVISTFSQESMMSEADSYVTVCSRMANTGSEELYTTACSDSELPVPLGHYGLNGPEEDCPTLSRRRNKLPRGQRNRARERRADRVSANSPSSSSSSSSSLEEHCNILPGEGDGACDDTMVRTPQPIVVTPKFSCLPSKLASPKDPLHDSPVLKEDYPVNNVIIESESRTSKLNSSFASKPTMENSREFSGQKRVALQRPIRKSPVGSPEPVTGQNYCDQEESNQRMSDLSPSSSGSSSSGDEADYDASEPLVWAAYPMGVNLAQPGAILLPNLVYKPSLQANFDLTEMQRKRLSCIEEVTASAGGSLSANEAGESETDDSPPVGNSSPPPLHSEPSSDERQSDSGVVLIPKYTYQSSTPDRLETTVTSSGRCIRLSTQHSSGDSTWASTPIQSTLPVVRHSNKPISEQQQQRQQYTTPTPSTNPLHTKINDQSKSTLGVTYVPPLAERVMNRCGESHSQQENGTATRVLSTNSEGDCVLETSQPLSANKQKPNEVESLDNKPTEQTEMYRNKNYYCPPEVSRSAHIYADSIRTDGKSNGSMNHHSTPSSMETNVMSTDRTECAALPLAAVLSSAEAAAARPSIYSPLQNESGEPYGVCSSLVSETGPTTMIESYDTRKSGGDNFSTRGLSPYSLNNSNSHGTSVNHTNTQHSIPLRTQRDSAPLDHFSESRRPYFNQHEQELEPEWNEGRVRTQRTILETVHAWPPIIPGTRESGNRVIRSPMPPVTPRHQEPENDIRVASQRTSRIVHGTTDYLDASVKLVMGPQVPIPQQAERSFIASPMMSESLDGVDWAPIPEENKCASSTPHTAGSILHDNQLASAVMFAKHSKTTPKEKYSVGQQLQGSHAIQLLQAPKHTGNVVTQSDHILETRRLRNISPSPPRTACELRPLLPRPLEVTSIQPKWQLRPIPTETEIRERLRSRSRQRVEERQSRSQRPDVSQTQVYRPRSSRSDSRYRCTDLDSAIAEFRADPGDMSTMHSSMHECQPLSEAKQSASLFDLDARTQKISTPIGISQLAASVTESSGIQMQNVSKSDKKFFGDAKSYNSLLETDIDTGENFERPLILETDVDRLDTRINSHSIDLSSDNKTQSLFNLTYTQTPGPYRRQNTVELNTIGSNFNTRIGRSESPRLHAENWQRTKSLQGLPHRGQESPCLKDGKSFSVHSHQSRVDGIGAKGLIERLRERAKSSYELRIAQSLSKLRVPEWLDKAECLSLASARDPDGHINYNQVTSKLTTGVETSANRPRTLPSSARSLSSTRKPVDHVSASKWLRKSPIVETVAEPTWPRAGGSQGTTTTFIRPSQQFRERGDSLSRLKPIRSKLYSSMRSLAANRLVDGPQTPEVLRPQVAPRLSRNKANGCGGQGTAFQLSPQDFLPKHEQLWGRNTDVLPRRYARSNTEPRNVITSQFNAVNCSYEYPKEGKYDSFDSDAQYHSKISPPPPPTSAPTQQTTNTHQMGSDDIKPADYDSGTEHSGEHGKPEKPDRTLCGHAANDKQSVTGPVNGTNAPPAQNTTPNIKIPCEQKTDDLERNHGPHGIRHSDDQYINLQSPQTDSVQSEQTASEWRSIDAEGESESEATDGLDQISDLTCLTNLIDTCAARHRALLANRPSALEHLLTSLGWWPISPGTEHQHLPPTATEAISIAAHEFDVEEDSHRVEFIQLLTGPESRRPINLGEFALNHLSGAVQRKQHDGLLYISCGRAECTKSPIQVTQATEWRACANCYTLYCSTTCRALDRRALHDHPTVCSFARAKRVCNRVLRNLAPGQITGLTALAKTGMARLGRGGILLPFALIRHAELFLKRAQSQAWNNAEADDAETSLEQAASCWEQTRQPSPGGLIAPPLYLTLQELQELDSTVANPCKTYQPSTSMVLIIVVCAYELISRTDGRPVHLFKQSLVLPFPAHNMINGKRQSIGDKSASMAPAIPSKPIMPQTNGLLSRPDRQAAASREAYMIRLQRMLRERGVSLRHHHPDIYTQIANFVETGVPFSPIRITFHDFVLREEVLCVIRPMHDPQIYSVRQMRSQAATSRTNDYYEEIRKGNSNEATSASHTTIDPRSNAHAATVQENNNTGTIPQSNRGLNDYHRWQETNF